MPVDSTAPEDDLFARADRAIADAVATRARVWADLTAAGRRRVHRPHAGDLRPSDVPPPGPMVPPGFLEPWWSVARALAEAGEPIWTADRAYDLALARILPGIETPPSLFEG